MFQSPDSGNFPSHHTRKVLVVDDEPTLRLGFSYALSSRETSVDTAATGRLALEKMKTTTYDIVILDLRMPDIDGIGVIEALRKQGNFTPIVLCSAALTPTAALRAIQCNVVDFLLKPVRPADLRDVIDFVLGPPDQPLSHAMAAAREGKISRALEFLKGQKNPDRRVAAWLEMFTLLLEKIEDSVAGSRETLLRSSLATLAFRSQATP
jgi:CheY-like chemotaxis protein